MLRKHCGGTLGAEPLGMRVVGLGAGGVALHYLSRSGHAVLGIDGHAPPLDLGSTHGEARITQLTIGEGSE